MQSSLLSRSRLRPADSGGISSKNSYLWIDPIRNLGTVGARTFNGIDKDFSIPNQNLIGLSDFSIDCWIKPTLGSEMYLFKQFNATTNIGYGVYLGNTGLIYFLLSNTITQVSFISVVAVTTGVWQHLLLNVDRDNLLSYYINGALVDTDNISALAAYSVDTGNATWFLGSSGTNKYFSGSIARFGIATGLRTSAEIAELFNVGNGKFFAELSSSLASKFILRCNMNEVTGNTIDQTGHFVLTSRNDPGAGGGPREAIVSDIIGSNHGTLVGFSNTVSPWINNTPDGSYSSLKRDSIGSYHGTMNNFTDVDMAHIDNPNGSWGTYIADNGTLQNNGWLTGGVKDSRVQDVPAVLNLSYSLNCNGTSQVVQASVASMPTYAYWANLNGAGWHHYAWDGSNQYVDGVVAAHTAYMTHAGSTLTIGKTGVDPHKIALAQVYSSLSATEIANLALGQSAGSPTGNWRFNNYLNMSYLNGCKALKFNGTSSYISFTNINLTGAFTFSCWVKPYNLNAVNMLLGDITTTNQDGIQIDATTGKISITVGTANTVISTSGLAIGVWQHIVVTRAAGTNALLVYINGINDTAGSPTRSGTLKANAIGATRSGVQQNFLNGDIADVRIYSAVITQDQARGLIIGTDYSTNLVAQLKFHDSPRVVASCSDGYALEFNGSTDYVEIPAFNKPIITVATWVKRKKNGVEQHIIDSNAIQFYFSASNVLNAYLTSAVTDPGDIIPMGEWCHVALVYDGSKAYLYRNGVNVINSVVAYTPTLQPMYMAKWSATYSNIALDDARIYLSALSSGDIAILAAGGEPSITPYINWTFDDGPQGSEPSNGDPIATYYSKDINHYMFIQETAARRPTYVQYGQNNKPALRFNGTSQYLYNTSHIINETEGTVLVVFTPSGVSSTDAIFGESDQNNNSYIQLKTHSGKLAVSASGVSGGIGSTTLVPATTYLAEFTNDGTKAYIKLNNVAETVTASGTGNLGTWFGDLPISALPLTTIGGSVYVSNSSYLEGDIYEMAFLKKDVRLKDIDTFSDSLISKYRIG